MPGYDQPIKTNSKFLKIEAGEPHEVRLLNPEPLEIYIHKFAPPKKQERCGGDQCPYCENGDEPTQNYITNAYDFNTGKVKIWQYGSMIGKQLVEIYRTLKEEGRQLTDTDLKVTATGTNLAKRYQITPRGTSKLVPAGLQLHDLAGDGKVFETGEGVGF